MTTPEVRDLKKSIEFHAQGRRLLRMAPPLEAACFTLNKTWLDRYGHDDPAEE